MFYIYKVLNDLKNIGSIKKFQNFLHIKILERVDEFEVSESVKNLIEDLLLFTFIFVILKLLETYH